VWDTSSLREGWANADLNREPDPQTAAASTANITATIHHHRTARECSNV